MQRPASLLLLAALTIGAAAAHAQDGVLMPFLAQEGIATALAAAKDSLGADAALTFIGAVGNLETGGFAMNVYLNDRRGKPPFVPAAAAGAADAWGYSFHSASRGMTLTLFVVKLPLIGFRTQSLGASLPVPVGIGGPMTMAEPYAGSDGMIRRLQQNDDFHVYHSRYPDVGPDLVTLGELLGASPELPEEFPLDGPIWSMTFRAHGDSVPGMLCFVSATSGETFCREIALPSLGVSQVTGAAMGASLAVTPNPARGAVTLRLDRPPYRWGEGGASMGLYDEGGRLLLDLTRSLADGGGTVRLDTRGLASGVYYCRAAGEGWSATGRLVVGR